MIRFQLSIPQVPRGDRSLWLCQCVKTMRKSSSKTRLRERKHRWSAEWMTASAALSIKMPPTRSRRVFFLYFLHKDPLKHPQRTPSGCAERMEPFKKQFFSLCHWVPTECSLSSVTRDLSTKGHRLCGSDRHNYSTVCALTLPNPALN